MQESSTTSENTVMFIDNEVVRMYYNIEGLDRKTFEEKTGLRFTSTRKIKNKRYYIFKIMDPQLCSYARIKYGF